MLANPFRRERSTPPRFKQSVSRAEANSGALRQALTSALQERRHPDALGLIAQLEAVEPDDPRWPHKRGDVLRAAGKRGDAAAAYRRAAVRYNDRGFPAREAAMLSLAEQLAPNFSESATDEHDMI